MNEGAREANDQTRYLAEPRTSAACHGAAHRDSRLAALAVSRRSHASGASVRAPAGGPAVSKLRARLLASVATWNGKPSQFWQHLSPLLCPKRHVMGWLGGPIWICGDYHTIYVETRL